MVIAISKNICLYSFHLSYITSPNEVEVFPDKSTLDDLLYSGHVVEYSFTRRCLIKEELHKAHASWQEQEQPRTRLEEVSHPRHTLFPQLFIDIGSSDLKFLLTIHPKSGSPDSANYLNFPQNYSLITRKLPTLLS